MRTHMQRDRRGGRHVDEPKVNVTFRLDRGVKEEAMEVARANGLSLSAVLRAFCHVVARERRVPLDLTAADGGDRRRGEGD